MKKLFSFFIFIILCIMIPSMYYIKSHSTVDSPEATLIKSFDNSGAEVVNSEMYFWARMTDTYKSFEELKLLAENISNKLGVVRDNTYVINTVNNDLMDKLEIRGITGKSQVVGINIRVDKKDGKTVERTLAGTITQDLSNSWLEETGKNLKGVLKKYDIDPEINTCIVGSYEGLLDDGRLNDIALDILKGAEAKKIEGMRDSRLISVSAYSPNISDSIKVSGKRINLNLAIRHNTYENKTYIWLATPVITKEY